MYMYVVGAEPLKIISKQLWLLNLQKEKIPNNNDKLKKKHYVIPLVIKSPSESCMTFVYHSIVRTMQPKTASVVCILYSDALPEQPVVLENPRVWTLFKRRKKNNNDKNDCT